MLLPRRRVPVPAQRGTIRGNMPGLYAHFAVLLDKGESDVDLRPFCHVVDAPQPGPAQERRKNFHEQG